MKLKTILAGVGIAAVATLGLTACADGYYDAGYASAPYSRICEDPYTHLRVMDSQCGMYPYIWYYYPPTVIYPGIGMHIVPGGYTHISAHYHYTSVSINRPRYSPARSFSTARRSSGYSSGGGISSGSSRKSSWFGGGGSSKSSGWSFGGSSKSGGFSSGGGFRSSSFGGRR